MCAIVRVRSEPPTFFHGTPLYLSKYAKCLFTLRYLAAIFPKMNEVSLSLKQQKTKNPNYCQ